MKFRYRAKYKNAEYANGAIETAKGNYSKAAALFWYMAFHKQKSLSKEEALFLICILGIFFRWILH